MASATAYQTNECPSQRFAEEMFAGYERKRVEPKPGKPMASPHTCPFCEQSLPQARRGILAMFAGGVSRFAVAIFMILGAILRCVRLVIAAALCLVGLVGSCCRTLGIRIAHRDDRRLFESDHSLRRAS